MITANTKEIAEELQVLVSEFLQKRGLTLSEEKTMITHIDDGFDFLGWTFRKFKGKLIIKPSKTSINTLIRKCSTIILKEGKAVTQSQLIIRLNQVIRGWSNYHRHVVASQAFSSINNTIYLLLKQWAKHRHPNLQISKNPFLDEKYFTKRRMILKSLNAARKGEEMLEPYERETLTYGS